jgi:release factor glutamine methyltransferase
MSTVAEALRTAAERLAAESDTARLDAEVLMAHALGSTRSDMLLRLAREPAPEQFPVLVERRLNHEPVAYITGWQEFYGRAFRVTPDVLIPRADSETTLAAALAAQPAARRVLDCGTGSGALLVTCLLEALEAHGVGIDRSAAALAVAENNARRLGLGRDRVRFDLRDWTRSGWEAGLGEFDLVVCNPPYVEDAAPLAPSVRDYEPAEALFAGPDGLDDYRIIVPQLPALLSPTGVAVVEMGAAQGDSVAQIAAEAGFFAELRRDLGGRPRAIILRKS